MKISVKVVSTIVIVIIGVMLYILILLYILFSSVAGSIPQRYIFLCSPVLAEKNLLEGIGKKLKKNNVALDIVSFGEEDGDKGEKLEALLNAVNSNDNSHIVHINGGERVLSDVLIR